MNTLVTSGVTVPETEGRLSSNALSLTGYANYELPAQHLNLDGYVQRQQQTYLGIEFATDSVNGTAMYTNRLLGGVFSGVLGVTETSVEYHQPESTGFEYLRQLHASDPSLGGRGRFPVLAGHPNRTDRLYDLRL